MPMQSKSADMTQQKTFRLHYLTATIVSLGVLSGCATTPQQPKTVKTTTVKNPTTNQTAAADDDVELLDAESFDSLEGLLYATDMRAVENDRLLILRHGDVWKRMTVGFKMNLNNPNPRIAAQRSWFTSRQPYIDRLSARASRYLHYTVREAERRGMPTELALLPVIESSYDPAATSSAAAAGLWQFIPSTGRIYGLRQSELYDGRRDVVESTRAAYEFLGSLYNQFGSWELALAAYNAGPGRVQQAINRNAAAGLPTDYWSLRLPTETMHYVPRFLAVAQIVKNPEKFGVYLPPIANRPHFREVAVPGAIDLDELASITNLSRGELYALNPAHRGNYTDPLAPKRILIPNDVAEAVDKKIAKMRTVSGSGGMWTGKATLPSYTPTVVNNTKPSTPSVPAVSSQITTQVSPTLTNQPTPTLTQSITTVPVVNTTVNNVAKVNETVANISTKAPDVKLPNVATNNVITTNPPVITTTPASNIITSVPTKPVATVTPSGILGTNTPSTSNIVTPPVLVTATNPVVNTLPTTAETMPTEVLDDPLATQVTPVNIADVATQNMMDNLPEVGETQITYAYPKAVAEAIEREEKTAKNKKPQAQTASQAKKPTTETKNDVVVAIPKGRRDVYTVQTGDSLQSIANRFGVNWRDLAGWNQINPNGNLLAGTRLYVYNAKNIVKPEKYTVRSGDTLSSIAQQFNLSSAKIMEWNGMSSTQVQRGQTLTLVEPKKPVERPKVVAQPKIATDVYTVKRGDSMQALASRFGMSTQDLASLTSNLTANSQLAIGQKINVPKQLVTANTKETETEQKLTGYERLTDYKVQSGESLRSLAEKFDLSVQTLANLNKLKTDAKLQRGQTLKVPVVAIKSNLPKDKVKEVKEQKDTKADDKAKANEKVKATAQPERKEEKTEKVTRYRGATESYQVKSGESLNGLSARYKISAAQLADLNDLKSNASLRAGQSIKVPKLTQNYKVKSGDSLIKIAKQFDISPEQLAEMNGLKPNSNVQQGRTLVVPNR